MKHYRPRVNTIWEDLTAMEVPKDGSTVIAQCCRGHSGRYSYAEFRKGKCRWCEAGHPENGEVMLTVSVRLPVPIKRWLSEIAAERGVPESTVLRDAVTEYLSCRTRR